MRSTDTLFQLIKSLSQSEKRFFKLETSKYSRKDQNDYLVLYKLLDKQAEYDEVAIKKALKGSKILSRLPGVKNYLFNLILKALAQYHAERNSHQQISTLLQQIDILFSKGLYKAARKLLVKARKIADDFERLSYQIIISEWEHKFADLEDKFWKTEKKMAKIQEQENAQLLDLKLKLDLEKLHEEVVTIMYTEGMPRNEEGKKPFIECLNNPLLTKAKIHPSTYIKNLYHSMSGLCLYMCMERTKALAHSKARFELLEQNLSLLYEDNHEYAIASFNYLQILTLMEYPEQAIVYLDKVLAFLEHPKVLLEERSKEFFFLVKYYHSSNIYLLLGEFQKAVEVGLELKKRYKGILETKQKNRLFFVIPVNLSIANFILDDFDEALYWIRSILNDAQNNIRLDTIGWVRILHLIIQYELGNHSILEYHLDSTQRFFIEHGKFTDFERILMRFLRQIIGKNKWDNSFESILLKAKSDLSPYLLKESYEKMFLEHYHILEWINSKLEKGRFLDFVVEKIKKHE